MTYEMNLHNNPFNKIKQQSKTIEMRLNDGRRKLLKKDDLIIFTNNDTKEQLTVKIIDITSYQSFKEIYEKYDKVLLGYDKDDNADYNDMLMYYSQDKIDKYGVLAIQIKVI